MKKINWFAILLWSAVLITIIGTVAGFALIISAFA